jgi:hypothetical protein
VTPNLEALNRLLEEKQQFFLRYYQDVVAQHPEGIAAAEVKRLVALQLLDRFDIDISDPTQTGLNVSTNRSQADQWANNLVSNQVLDDYMLVVRDTRATLYPGAADNSRPVPQPGHPLTDGEVSELDHRRPTRIETKTGPTYRRSIQLAEHVRGLTGRRCAIAKPACVVFDGRDGRPYVEVHHIVPIAMQARTDVNLDRSTNMAPVCPGCHTHLHYGQVDTASAVLDELLRWFESVHGMSFESANAEFGFNTTSAHLLAMYGSDAAAG